VVIDIKRTDRRVKLSQQSIKNVWRGAVLLMLACLLVAASGCQDVVRGSGATETLEFDYRDFNVIRADGIFDLLISQQETYGLSVTVSRELTEYLEVSRHDNVLELRLRPGVEYVNTIQRAEISLPQLVGINLGGATAAEISSFVCDEAFEVDMDGASHLVLADVTTCEMRVTLSGAARIDGDLKLVTGRFRLIGASVVDLKGSAGALVLNASDAANADLGNFTITEANVNISDAAKAEVDVSGTLNVVASGASVLHYFGEPELGLVNVSGTATLGRG
jgi:hypothetical protein